MRYSGVRYGKRSNGFVVPARIGVDRTGGLERGGERKVGVRMELHITCLGKSEAS